MTVPVAVVTFGAGDVTCLVESATIRHGRDDPTSQPDASAATFDILGELPAGVDIGTTASIYAVLDGISYPRFVGEITDIQIGWDAVDAPTCQIIAVGALAQMGYRIVGTTAYPSESDGARANRVISEAAVPTDAARTDPGTLTVLARAVDPQPGMTVAQEAAEDGAGYIWQAKDGVVLYADADHRRAEGVALALDCETMPLEVTWTKNLEGLTNDVRVSWGSSDGDGGGDGDGGDTTTGGRLLATYTTASLAAGASESGSLTLAPSYRLLRIRSTYPARARLYTTSAKLAADASRPVGTDPAQDEDVGCMLEFITAAGLLSADLSPTVDGFTETPDSSTVPINVTNEDSVSRVITVTLTYLRRTE